MNTLKVLLVAFQLFCSFYLTMGQLTDVLPNIESLPIGNRNLTEILHKAIYSEDGLLNFTGLARKYLGKCEEYDVTTEDGYILKLFHIPGNTTRPVVICSGILVTTDNFLIRGNISLIYMMAKQGFDVWAMSYRGTRYSRRHVILNANKDDAYWQFSMHEIGIYDYKANIDFILEKTGQKQLSVVAHSEGSSALFILTSERPEYNDKINVFVALAPVCYLRHVGPTLTALLKAGPVINSIFKLFHIEKIHEYYSTAKAIVDIICSHGIIGYELCFNMLGSITGFNPKNIEPGFTTTILGHSTASSRKNLLHYMNVYEHNNFVKFDYGLYNIAIYGTIFPPVYDLNRVSAKVAIFAAKRDILAAIKDVRRLRSNLPNVIHYQVVEDPKFNHIDYMWGLNAHRVLYLYVTDILLKYN